MVADCKIKFYFSNKEQLSRIISIINREFNIINVATVLKDSSGEYNLFTIINVEDDKK